jgi:hypothetical protein
MEYRMKLHCCCNFFSLLKETRIRQAIKFPSAFTAGSHHLKYRLFLPSLENIEDCDVLILGVDSIIIFNFWKQWMSSSASCLLHCFKGRVQCLYLNDTKDTGAEWERSAVQQRGMNGLPAWWFRLFPSSLDLITLRGKQKAFLQFANERFPGAGTQCHFSTFSFIAWRTKALIPKNCHPKQVNRKSFFLD